MKHAKKSVSTLAATLLALGSITGGVNAASILTTATGSTSASITSTRGFAFNTTSDFLVTHLSFYDEDGLGLAESHEIGLWNSSGTLLIQGTVPAGTSAPLLDGIWRLVDVPDFILPAGLGYVVGATFNSGSADRQFTSIPSTISNVQWVEGRFINNGIAELTFPTSTLSFGLGGGNIIAQPIPEPSSFIILSLGVLTIASRRLRNK